MCAVQQWMHTWHCAKVRLNKTFYEAENLKICSNHPIRHKPTKHKHFQVLTWIWNLSAYFEHLLWTVHLNFSQMRWAKTRINSFFEIQKKLRKIKMNRTIPEHQYTEKKDWFFFIECTFETCSIWIFVFNICLQYTHRTHPLSFLSIIVFTFCSWYVFLDMYAPAHNEAVAVFYLLRAGKFQCVLCKCTHTQTLVRISDDLSWVTKLLFSTICWYFILYQIRSNV